MPFQVFNNKIAIVTGAASGLGRGMSEVMAANGATIIAADINLEGVQQTAANIEKAGGTAEAHQLDVADAEAVQALVDGTVAKHKRIDYIFNNAGIAVNGMIEDIPLKDWDDIIDINLKGVVYGTSAAYKQMVKQGYGHIVNTASLAGLTPAPLLSPYSTVKYGVVGLCESMRLEAGAHNIKVTALCPGFVDSGIYDASRYSSGLDGAKMKKQIPMMVDTKKGVDKLLQGVVSGKRIVTFPLYAHISWRSYRYVPKVAVGVSTRVARMMAKRGRS